MMESPSSSSASVAISRPRTEFHELELHRRGASAIAIPAIAFAALATLRILAEAVVDLPIEHVRLNGGADVMLDAALGPLLLRFVRRIDAIEVDRIGS
jgi:hypothetical protein